ncbi:hypothetical protein [uncultured Amaricoccus sp.]|uniref:hypothetical protein n=1 Tax=uncultured Amaricoccus sp. TaxID=339341 RepID=UPI00261F46C2|nr:hypothetical protein [uncultured Amaricoccus sp.]
MGGGSGDPASGVDFVAAIDGVSRQYRLRFGFAAMRAYGRLDGGGEGFLRAVRSLRDIEEDPDGFDRVHRLFLAGLEPRAGAEEVDAVIDALGLVPAMELLGRAVRAAMPGEPPEAGAGAAEAPPGER